VRRLLFPAFVAVMVVLICASPASAVSIVVSRSTAAIGDTVVVSGDTTTASGTHCAAGEDVTLISDAFKGHSEFAGVGAVVTKTDVNGRFRVSVTILAVVTPKTHTITARCGGANLGVEASLTVTGLPHTGAASARDIEAGVGLLLVGALLVGLARRRRRALI
jgi:LPXTG-motif cell wall-anchored protein